MKYNNPFKLYNLPDPTPYLRRPIERKDIPIITIDSIDCPTCEGGCMVPKKKEDE